MERDNSSTDKKSTSSLDFGWEDFTVSPGQYDVPKASDIQGGSSSSVQAVEGSTQQFNMGGWEDFTTKTDETPKTIDEADGDNSIFTLDVVEPEPRAAEDDAYDQMIDERVNSGSAYAVGRQEKSSDGRIAEALGIDEERVKKMRKLGGTVLKIGAKALLPGLAADLATAGIDFVLA